MTPNRRYNPGIGRTSRATGEGSRSWLRPIPGSSDWPQVSQRRQRPLPTLNIRTSADLYEQTLAKATREGKTVSQLAREALEKYVK